MSSTRPGATPIRAITTPLRSTAAPPIPPPSALYIPLAKNVLQRRLARRIFPFTFAICLGVSVLWLAWMDGVGKMKVGRVIGATLGLWVGSVVPVVLVRKAYLTVTHTTAPSPFLLLQKSFLAPGPLRARTLHALQAHVLGALAVLAVHAALDPAIPIFIRSRKHPYTPHPTLVLLATTQLLFAALYVVRATLRDAWVWPFAASGSRRSPLPTPAALLAPPLLALLALPPTLVLLFVVLPIVKRVPGVSIPLRHTLLRPHLTAALLFRTLPRAWALGAQTGWVWEASGVVWAWVVSEPLQTTPASRTLISGISVAVTPMPVPSASTPGSAFATPARASSIFLSGAHTSASTPLPSENPTEPTIYTHLAYAELLLLASTDSPAATKARNEVFDVEGAVWGRFVREALILLGREYQVLKTRGGALPSPPPPPPPPTPASASGSFFRGSGTGAGTSASAIAGPTSSPITLHKQNIFAPRKAPASPVARVSSLSASVFASNDSPEGSGGVESFLAPAVKPAAAAVKSIPLPAAPRWEWRPLMRALMPIVPVPGWVKGAVGRVVEMVAGGSEGGSGGKGHGWKKERKGREVRGWVPRAEVVIECIGVLTHLTTASLAEDRFGVVQRDIPRILEALVAFLVAIEDAQAQLRPPPCAKSGSGGGELPVDERALIGVLETVEDAVGVAREKDDGKAGGKGHVDAEEEADLAEARAVLGEVGDALTDGLSRITRTFGDKLRAFRFAPRTAARLGAFVEFA
ncbi:hypothetical protein B0H16DRAFT_1878634 [Mycena metata]|uniref:Nucleoporin NDC1 n=1 Tax=Mycena metata TaxID=1033252 RepID=A0AAD7K691_9AGAR|nr:hypothetical protein B0H16DRAFT_1878634 [Mycena metata]